MSNDSKYDSVCVSVYGYLGPHGSRGFYKFGFGTPRKTIVNYDRFIVIKLLSSYGDKLHVMNDKTA